MGVVKYCLWKLISSWVEMIFKVGSKLLLFFFYFLGIFFCTKTALNLTLSSKLMFTFNGGLQHYSGVQERCLKSRGSLRQPVFGKGSSILVWQWKLLLCEINIWISTFQTKRTSVTISSFFFVVLLFCEDCEVVCCRGSCQLEVNEKDTILWHWYLM